MDFFLHKLRMDVLFMKNDSKIAVNELKMIAFCTQILFNMLYIHRVLSYFHLKNMSFYSTIFIL